MNPLLITSATVGGVGLVCGTALAMAAKFLSVKEDPRVAEIDEILPGANCGGCGYAGCTAYAEAIVLKDAPINMCAPGGAEVLALLAQATGQNAEAAERKVAVVFCAGDNKKAPRKHLYNGLADCAAAHSLGGGDKLCSYGCLGYGSCVRVCPNGSISLVNGLAIVNPRTCIGCGACVRTCPRNLIEMVPESKTIHVLCSSKDKGPIAKKACKVSCIGCRMCLKLAGDSFEMTDKFLAARNYDIPVEKELIIEKCPGKCIIKRGKSEVPQLPPEKPAATTSRPIQNEPAKDKGRIDQVIES